MHDARRYVIRVQGHLGPAWSDWFEGLTLTQEHGGPDGPVTVLRGVLTDEAALYGLLAKLQRLHLPLLRLERLPSRGNEEQDDGYHTQGQAQKC